MPAQAYAVVDHRRCRRSGRIDVPRVERPVRGGASGARMHGPSAVGGLHVVGADEVDVESVRSASTILLRWTAGQPVVAAGRQVATRGPVESLVAGGRQPDR